jgi:glyoxylase-like metal-dependent hydrolase (beta-lactamase superfamily II)
MHVHHLNCGSMRELSAIRAGGRELDPRPAVNHCLLVETDDGLVLVDTGFGMNDVRDADATLGPDFIAMTAPRLDPEETAVRQVERLGFTREDVRHIVVTHLDVDHAGGLADFPHARVHVHAEELAAATGPRPLPPGTGRYRSAHWAHGPEWVGYPADRAAGGEAWFGFDAVRPLDGLPPDILLVPLGGHTRGHSGVAVRAEGGDGSRERWLLHAGDAYYFHGEMDPDEPTGHPELDLVQDSAEVDRPLRLGNQARLRELARLHGGEVSVFSAHDPWDLDRLAAGGGGAASTSTSTGTSTSTSTGTSTSAGAGAGAER